VPSAEAEEPTPGAPASRGPSLRSLLIVGALAIVLIVVGILVYPRSSTTTSASGPARVGSAVPHFSLPVLEGSGRVGVPADGGADGRAAVLLFFASWCAPCNAEMPALAPLLSTGTVRGAEVIGVNALDATGPARDFVARYHLDFPIGVDSMGSVTNGDFGFPALPEVVFVSGHGTITGVHYGETTPAQLEAGAAQAAAATR
jgi:peroxiredoxin